VTTAGRRGAIGAPAAPVPTPSGLPEVSYVICTTPRSGSWLLAEALLATGAAGRPEEYFRPDWYRRFRAVGHLDYQHRLDFWSTGDRDEGINGPAMVPSPGTADSSQIKSRDTGSYRTFLETVRAIGTLNGVFAVKIHRNQLSRAVKYACQEEPGIDDVALLASWLPQPRFIFLRRLDTIRRAVSHYRALQTGMWWNDGTRRNNHRAVVDGASPPIDPAKIHRLLQSCALQEWQWEDFFRRAGINPLRISYEDLVLDLDRTIAQVLGHVNGDAGQLLTFPPPRLHRQADAWTEVAVHRYITWRRAQQPGNEQDYGFDGAGLVTS
jgi:LPS sulfotransferase NodH